MKIFTISGSLRTVITLIIIAMAIPIKSQSFPASDIFRTKAGDVEIRFIGHGSLMFRLNNMIIYFDPVKSVGNYDNLPKADLILVTHEHYDHLDPDLIKELRKDETIIITNEASVSKVPGAKAMKAGEKQTVKGIEIEAVAAYNIIHERSKGQPFHPKGVGIGYILGIGDKKFYIAGDTENTKEMKALRNIDVAFLPMNLPYTMTPEMVADAANSFKPAILYPYHYGDTNTEQLIRLLKNSGIEVRIRDLK
jgi:L-ascorbate metabolism protein UlaG (beta-lactamase superfamily)